jgi:hypothetical protein
MSKWLIIGVEVVTTFAGVSSALWLNPACNLNIALSTPGSAFDHNGNMSCLESSGIGAPAGAAAGALILLGLWGGHYIQRKFMNGYQPINDVDESNSREGSPRMQNKG